MTNARVPPQRAKGRLACRVRLDPRDDDAVSVSDRDALGNRILADLRRVAKGREPALVQLSVHVLPGRSYVYLTACAGLCTEFP